MTTKLIQELVGICVEKSNENTSVNFHLWSRTDEIRVSIRHRLSAAHDDQLIISTSSEGRLQAAIDKIKEL
jgi:hypothetical protein